MRIVQSFPHPSRDLDRDGSGQAVRARALREALTALGHDVVTVARGGDGVERAVVDRYRRGAGQAVPGVARRVLRDAGRLAYGRRHAARVAGAVRRHRADVILETHVALSISGARASALTGVPLVVDDLAPIWEERTFGLGLPAAADRVWRAVTHRARVLVAVNQPIRAALEPDVDAGGKLIVVGNGFDPRWVRGHRRDRDAVLRSAAIDPDRLVFVFVGSFLPWHRTDLLVAALAAAGIDRPWHLLLVGDGPQRQVTERVLADLGLAGHVTLTGQVSPAAVADAVTAADVAVLPATNAYGNPMKLVEYLALGAAVVAPRQPTVEELCTHDRTAWLFTPGSVGDLAAALRLVADDDGLRHRLGRAAAASAVSLRWDRQAARLIDGIRCAGIAEDDRTGAGMGGWST